ncbi:hypothetical protein SGRIM128S_08700 [Streptomyces griseomycini]
MKHAPAQDQRQEQGDRAGVVAAAVAGGGAFLFTGTAQAAGVGAAYTRTASAWSTG